MAMGVGPAAQAAAYNEAGVCVTEIAGALDLEIPQVVALVRGIRLHEARETNPDLELLTDPGICTIGDCGRAVDRSHLCQRHASRLYRGKPLLSPLRLRPIRIRSCEICGARWCELEPRKRDICLRSVCKRHAQSNGYLNAARDAEILARVRAGELYTVIAADYGLTSGRVAQIANRNGVFRYKPRSQLQIAARTRHLALLAQKAERESIDPVPL